MKWLLARQAEGIRISQAVNYWKELLNSGIDPLEDKPQPRQANSIFQIEDNNATLESLQKDWIEYCLNFDESHADQILSLAFAQFPIETVFSALILPSLNMVGQLWYEGEVTVQQEHFISEIAIKKIETLITAAPHPVHAQRILIFCPPNEHHIIAGLLLTLLLKHRGWDVLYLGANVPLDHLGRLINSVKPSLAVLTASRLSTSASLLKTINLLLEYKIPAAYGGWIFERIPDLVSHIPASYLGTDLPSSIENIESLISNPRPHDTFEPRPLQHQKLVKKLNNMGPELNSLLRTKLSNTNNVLNTVDIYEINQHLIRDISAALTFGDTKILRFNLNWLSGLIGSRNIDYDQLRIYLNLFSSTVEELLGPEANIILGGLVNPAVNIL